MMMRDLKDKITAYKMNVSGQVFLWTSLAAFPLALGSGMVADMRTADIQSRHLEVALIATSKVVAAQTDMTPTEKLDYADIMFEHHYRGALEIDLDVAVLNDRIELSGTGYIVPTARRAFGAKTANITQTAATRYEDI